MLYLITSEELLGYKSVLKEAFVFLYSSSIVLCVPWTIDLSLFSNVSEEGMEKGESEPCHLISECYTLKKKVVFVLKIPY